MVIQLADAPAHGLDEIGGKAASLARLLAAGYRVPEALVLPASWFSPWWRVLESTEAWSRFTRTREGPWREPCEALQSAAACSPFSAEMRAGLDEVRRQMASWGEGATCAVRSSSPEEDLEAASFAGGYATVLGVVPDDLEDAVRACFVSCLDERVAVYKQQRGFDVHRPRIAVVVQRQLDSDVAGVAFSLNPITNDYDEAVIDASFGLGESVVSGDVSPDHFVVDRPARKILERHAGSKGVTRRLRPGGGVDRSERDRSGEQALDDAQVLELVDALDDLEKLYGVPIDIEWAYVDGALHLLQARPITAWVPIPRRMQTQPGERRRLWADGGLTDYLTTNAPLTRLTLDLTDRTYGAMSHEFGIPYQEIADPAEDFLCFEGARFYADMSPVLAWLSPKQLAAPSELSDRLLARTLLNLDRARYRAQRGRSSLSGLRLLRSACGMLVPLARSLPKTLLAYVSVARFRRRFAAAHERFDEAVRSTTEHMSVGRVLSLVDEVVRILFDADLLAIYPWATAGAWIEAWRRRADPETRQLLDQVNCGFEGEIVVDMGIEMFALTRLLEPSDFEDLDELAQRIEARDAPEAFLRAWDAFLARFGCRGPLEMELRSPRYGDSPRLLLRQMSFMAALGPDDDPAHAHARNVAQRKRAHAELQRRSGWLRRLQLRLAHHWIEAYAGERDTAKHSVVVVVDVLRRKALTLAEALVASGRLDSQDDVFHLTWEELERAETDPSFDPGPLARERGREFRRVEAQVSEFPHLIDSRGRIMRPAPENGDGALRGLGISPGVASGPIKVLRDPYEKDIEPGDVLVAYTTDPGWTPLFVNASAIILQVGGMMQHGGVVAREYGKPCVAGIEHSLTRFHDGQIVEVDGTTGTIRELA